MQALVKQFVEEHILVNKCLQYLQTLIFNLEKPEKLISTMEKIEAFIPLVQKYILDVHHLGEEKFLFPLVFKNIPLNHGGPRCTYFMTYKLTNDPTSWILKAAEQRGIDIHLPDQYSDYVKANSPLLIPIEEHWAGEIALKMALAEIKEIKDKKTKDVYRLIRTLENYIELIHLHSKKEDDCLFVLCDQNLSSELQLSTLKQYQQMLKDKNSPEIEKQILKITDQA